ncbi:MAG: hypothetical protein QJR01_00165 [Kyrpidia sp.]|nr:hypothetical protein [Kyrpidia sp.]
MAAVKPLGYVATRPNPKTRPGRAGLPRLSPETVRDRLSLVGVVLVSIGVLCWVISRDAAVTAQNYRIQALQAEVAGLEQENSQLESRVNQLSAPSRLVDVAKKMGLMQASPDQWRVLPASPASGGAAAR